jgi:hypothetical protein
MAKKTYTDAQIKELIDSLDIISDKEKKQYKVALKDLNDEQKQGYAEIFERAKEKTDDIEREYSPKFIELYQKKIDKIKEFVRKVLPKFRKKHEKEEVKKEEKESKKLLEELENL